MLTFEKLKLLPCQWPVAEIVNRFFAERKQTMAIRIVLSTPPFSEVYFYDLRLSGHKIRRQPCHRTSKP